MIKVVTNIYIISFNEIHVVYIVLYSLLMFLIKKKFVNVKPSYQRIIFLNINIYNYENKLYINLI